jgi:hypothetical protein
MKKELCFGSGVPDVVWGGDHPKKVFPKTTATEVAAFYNISVFSFCDYC